MESRKTFFIRIGITHSTCCGDACWDIDEQLLLKDVRDCHFHFVTKSAPLVIRIQNSFFIHICQTMHQFMVYIVYWRVLFPLLIERNHRLTCVSHTVTQGANVKLIQFFSFTSFRKYFRADVKGNKKTIISSAMYCCRTANSSISNFRRLSWDENELKKMFFLILSIVKKELKSM